VPTYGYECQACGHGFEEFQSITAGARRKCPSCGKLKLQRLIGPGAAVIFKGGGFYETDYRSSSYKAGEKAEKDGQKGDQDTSTKSPEKSPEKSTGKQETQKEPTAKKPGTEPGKPASKKKTSDS
jgi:putative FmdB family regulatory protein